MDNLFEAAHNPIFRQFKISDLLFTEYKCMAESAVFDIWSSENYFVYVLTGKLQWGTQQADYMIYAGEVAFVKKGANIIHKFFDEDFCALLIFMPDAYIRDICKMYSDVFSLAKDQETDSVLPLFLDTSLQAYFQSLCAYFYRKEATTPHLVEIKFKELLLNLISSDNNKGIASYFKSLMSDSRTPIQPIMEANFTYNLSLEEFARLCGRSLSSFKNEFKEIYNCAPGRWLTQKRLEYARNLLRTTDKNVNELVFECGFENASHFTRVFKEKYGMTPLKLRQT